MKSRPSLAAVGSALARLCLVLSVAIRPGPALAHPVDAASLVLRETSAGRFSVHFRAGSGALQRELAAPALFPAECRLAAATLQCGASGLSGTLRFPWLEGTLTRLMVDIQWLDGSRMLRVVTASSPRLSVYGTSGSGLAALVPILRDYAWLGVEHIALGFDHLFFVVALTFLVKRRGRLLATVTAFTLAHSATLAATALRAIEVPTAPVETMIALSIVLVCAECLRPHPTLTRRAPWLVAFAFGLLHGLGFASALLDIGLPERHLPSALFGFNVGVEVGQVAVIGGASGARALAARAPVRLPWAGRAALYAMGSVAAFWSLDRAIGIFHG